MAGSVQSVRRATEILGLLALGAPLGVGELASRIGLAKGTVHGLLRTLDDAGMVRKEPESGKYRLGAALLHLGSSYLRGDELRIAAWAPAEMLAGATGQAVQVGKLHRGQVLIVHEVRQPSAMITHSLVGALVPADATALGAVLLACTEGSTGSRGGPGRSSSGRPRERTPDLSAVRRQGWALSTIKPDPGIVSVACPIWTGEGLLGAIAVIGARTQILADTSPRADVLNPLLAVAGRVSRSLGHRAWSGDD